MAGEYNINWTDDQGGVNPLKPRFIINPNEINGPGNINSDTPLQVPGRFTVNYGELIAEDLLHILENFSSPGIEPANPTSGLLWFDNGDGSRGTLKVRSSDNTEWIPVGGGGAGGPWGANGSTIVGNFLAEAGQNYFIDTSGGAITATLPSTPNVGDVVGFTDLSGTWNTNSMFLNGNAANIMGLSAQMENDVQFNSFSMAYSTDAARGWVIVN